MEPQYERQEPRRPGPESPPAAESVHEPVGDSSPPRRTTTPVAAIAVAGVVAAMLVIALVVAAIRAG